MKDFLGHADVKSTEVYVQIDVGMKRETPGPRGIADGDHAERRGC